MPRAVLISVGELSLEPIKTLVESNGVTTATIAVSDTASLKNLDALTSKLSEQHQNAECLLVQASNGVEKSVSSFSGITTHLIYSSPETYLTQCLMANQANENADAAIQQYIQQYSKHVQSALNALEQDSTLNLCTIDDVLANPASFLKTVFEIDSQATEAEWPTDLVHQTMALSANAALVDNDELYELYDDALSVGQLFGEFSVHLSPDSDTFKNNAKLLTQVAKAIQQKNQQITSLNQQAKESTAKLSEKETQFSQLSEQLKQQSVKTEEQNSALSNELESQKQALSKSSEQLTAKEQECTTLQQSLDANTKELGAKAKEADENKAKLSEKDTQCNQLTQQIAEKAEQIAKAEEQSNTLKSELESQKQALNKASEQLTSKEQECTTLQQTLDAKTKELGAKAKEADEAKATLSDKEAQCKQLTQQLAEQTQEAELSQLQVVQLQEELEATVQQASKLESTEQALKASNEKASQLQTKLASAEEEQQLLLLQTTQLQEELEATVQKASKLESTEQALKESNEKASQLQTKLASAEEEQQLLLLQTTQLQEELEATVQQASKLESVEQALKASNEQALQLQQKLTCANEEAQLATLQIAQLQEELERTFSEYETVKAREKEATAKLDKQLESNKQLKTLQTENVLLTEQLAQLQQGLEKAELEKESLAKAHSELQQAQLEHAGVADVSSEKLQNAELELELASLQISQLQEELECYYNAWQEAQQNGIQVIKMGKNHQKVFSKAQAESLAVTGKYSEDGYQDAHFMLNNVLLGDGRHFAELAVKLVRIGEYIAIEFRDSSDGSLFQHFEDSVDEYGPFLRFFVQPPESHLEQQQVTFSRMNTSDRVLLMSVINLLAEHIQDSNINCQTVLTSSDWRTWRISAIKLYELIDDMPIWLSFDSVILKEEYQTEGYEHLWLSFHNMLVGDSWKEILELKVAATGINSGTATFCDAISLEFREQEDGTVPLLTWPPETVDEHGPKFTVSLSDLDNLPEVARADRLLILHLATNLPEIINKIAENAELVSRHKNEWAYAAQFLLAGPKEVSNSDNHEVYSLKEAISMGSYQHLLFSSYDNSTDVKLKAENINPDTFDAEVYLEFRNGNEKVIGNSTEFYGEDEFGPRVVIPLEVLLIELHSKSSTELDWAIQYFINIENKLTTLQNLDELIKRLWTNLLTRKKEIADN